MISDIKEIILYKGMISSLAKRELRGRYKASVLGFLWSFLNPLLQLVIYTIIFGIVLRSGIENFYLYLFVGFVPWTFFSTSILGASSIIVSQQAMITKIYFPREVLPIAYVNGCLQNMLYTFAIVVPVSLFSGVTFSFINIILLIVIIFIEYLITLGFAFISSSITVYLRDLEHILGILMMFWMYLTPLFYSIDIVPYPLDVIIRINPMTNVISVYRSILYSGTSPQLGEILYALFFGIVMAVVGFIVFNKLKKRFAEVL